MLHSRQRQEDEGGVVEPFAEIDDRRSIVTALVCDMILGRNVRVIATDEATAQSIYDEAKFKFERLAEAESA
jgi:hypothetical protein